MMTLRLRPHHLLCTLGYVGNGYSENFIKNMDYITSELNSNTPLLIQLSINTDDICICCPKKIDENACIENSSVLEYDKRVLEVFGINEQVYEYSYLLSKIKSISTENNLYYICGDCSWHYCCDFIKSIKN